MQSTKKLNVDYEQDQISATLESCMSGSFFH